MREDTENTENRGCRDRNQDYHLTYNRIIGTISRARVNLAPTATSSVHMRSFGMRFSCYRKGNSRVFSLQPSPPPPNLEPYGFKIWRGWGEEMGFVGSLCFLYYENKSPLLGYLNTTPPFPQKKMQNFALCSLISLLVLPLNYMK